MPAYSKQNYSGRGENEYVYLSLPRHSHLEHLCVNEKEVSFHQRCPDEEAGHSC